MTGWGSEDRAYEMETPDEKEWDYKYLIELIDQVEGDNHFESCGCVRGEISKVLRILMKKLFKGESQ